MRQYGFLLVVLPAFVVLIMTAPVVGQASLRLSANAHGEAVVRRDADLQDDSFTRRHHAYPSRLHEDKTEVHLIAHDEGRRSKRPSSSTGGKGKGKLPAMDPYAVPHIVDAAHRMDTHVDAAHYHLATANALLHKPNRTPHEEALLKYHAGQAHTAVKTAEKANAEEKFLLASQKRPYDGKVTKTSKYAPPYRNGKASAHKDSEASSSGRP